MINVYNSESNLALTTAFKQHWTKAKFSYIKNPRPDYGVMLVLKGRIDFISNQSDILSTKAGDMIFLPKGSHYDAVFHIESGEIDNYLINFESSGIFSDLTKPKLICESTPFSCVELFRQLVEESYNIEKSYFRSKGLLYLLLDSIMKYQNSKSNVVVEKAKSMLEKSENIPISQIARECSVSESGLRNIFKNNVGMSPTQYRLKEKLNKAKYLLESTDMSVGEISDKLDFFDTAYFCRVFGKHVGVSPKKYSQNKKL